MAGLEGRQVDGARERSALLRAGRRRIFIAGARRRVAVHLIERLIADPDVDVILAVDRGACPPTLLGCDPERFIFASADLSRYVL